jgi:hypothetical protein
VPVLHAAMAVAPNSAVMVPRARRIVILILLLLSRRCNRVPCCLMYTEIYHEERPLDNKGNVHLFRRLAFNDATAHW